MKLDIGCGEYARIQPGHTGVDLYIEDDRIVKASMDDLPYNDNSIEAIYSSHALEHMGKKEIPNILLEWYRVLEHQGTLTLLVPDLIWCVKNWLRYESTDWNLDTIFGNQDHAGEFHKTGFTKNIIANYVIDAGFKIINVDEIDSHSQNTIVVRAVKP